jgi:predicted phage terminase large subunit-like protein
MEKGRRLIIPLCQPVSFDIVNEPLPIAPYTFGALLGDGHFPRRGNPHLTCLDVEIVNRIVDEGYEVSEPIDKVGTEAKTYKIKDVSDSVKSLGLYHTLSDRKFIPEVYKKASIKDRFALIQGLMDTDGYAESSGKTYYYTISSDLAQDIKEILFSLGFGVTVTKKKAGYKKNGVRIECSDVYCLYIRGNNQPELFSLPRKKERCKIKSAGLRVESIVYDGKDYATCISITGNDKLYLATDCLVTHNSFTCLTKNLDGLNDPYFRCTIFRRYQPELKRQGGLIDESQPIYRSFGGIYKKQPMQWIFPSGAQVSFNAIATDDDLGSWQGSQLVRALIDEAATGWTEKQVLFLLSRLRSAQSKIKTQLIMTANPNINSFLKEWVDFCLDEDGVPQPGTEHKIRWFVVIDNKARWADSPEDCFELYGKPRGQIYGRGITEEQLEAMSQDEKNRLCIPKSFRFIPTGVYDNPYLLPPRNMDYLANLLAQPRVEQLIYLKGSWTAVADNDGYFKRSWCPIVSHVPDKVVARVRSWDFAASEKSTANPNPDWTAGVKMSRDAMGIYYVEDVVRFRARTDKVLKTVVETAHSDGLEECQVTIPKDPAASGAIANAFYIRTLAENGVGAKSMMVSGHAGKITRFKPFAALAESGAVRIVKGEWNEDFLAELENFDGTRNKKDDQVDATSDAFAALSKQIMLPTIVVPNLERPSMIPTL